MKTPRVYPPVECTVIDGDNVNVLLDLGFNIYHRVSVRLQGIDAPEERIPRQAAAAVVSTAAVREWLSRVSFDDLRVESVEFGKYAGRVIGDVLDLSRSAVEGRLSAWLLSEGYVKQYAGGEKLWTDEELLVIEQKQFWMDRPT